jgi:hypothetical protein
MIASIFFIRILLEWSVVEGPGYSPAAARESRRSPLALARETRHAGTRPSLSILERAPADAERTRRRAVARARSVCAMRHARRAPADRAKRARPLAPARR